MRRHRTAVALTLVAAVSGTAHAGIGIADPRDPRAFFVGKTMTYIIASAPGGGYDTYGRLIAKYLAKHLKLARVTIKNVAGGEGLDGVNELYAARTDGLTLGTFNTGALYAQIVRDPRVRFELSRMSWIGKAGDEARVLVVSTRSGFDSIESLRDSRRLLVFGALGAGGGNYTDSLLLARALDLKVRHVRFSGSRSVQLAMLAGTIDGAVGSASSYRAFVAKGHGRALVRVGADDADFHGVAALADVVSTPMAATIAKLVRSQAALLRWTAAPPGLRPDRLAVLRAAFMSAVRDPDLLAEAKKRDIPIVAVDGASLTTQVHNALDLREDVVALIREVVGPTQ